MALLGIDLGGTKIVVAIFTVDGKMISHEKILLNGRKGSEVGVLITNLIKSNLKKVKVQGHPIDAIGLSVPGIYNKNTGTVWAPNIPGWEDYPLMEELNQLNTHISATINNDRACYVSGESWMGNAKTCKDLIYLSVGTGIGAGIMVNGIILNGANDIAGALGWLTFSKTFDSKYKGTGYLEYYASGPGISRHAEMLANGADNYTGDLKGRPGILSCHDVFAAYADNDLIAVQVIDHCIELWGKTVANLVSIFNPQKIIIGGGVFGPAKALIPAIKVEALRWAQPISYDLFALESTALGEDAGVYGAAFLAWQHLNRLRS